ncbi:MAG: hypothetical protein WAK17_00195 [Candidatus Nitrosopolaris sp.]
MNIKRIFLVLDNASIHKSSSQSDDLFGPVMNMCSKINSMALPNGIPGRYC